MTKQKAVGLTVVGTALLCMVHFVNSVYMAGDSSQRELNQSAISLADNALPYNADTLLQLMAAWALPEEQAVATDIAADNPLAGYDNTRLGNTNIALLAIYQLQQPTAVLALQTDGQPVQYVRLMAGEEVGDIRLSGVSQRNVTIVRGPQQVELRLFNPVSASSEY
ncbi:hypothetical protein [Arsukibacterium indicum]|uniref:Type II secretion system protein GspC N-terminal domain-containing protein n=1 Tax=Arsukibacterium indicum TaxID=2848612 RepID=A0ABS6MG49_9GAMM|nr:hypothetical protein [Arsukibacterium indicum]MBV2127784.1 hypothetical protein [Arsukibacterium indicum]